MQALRRGLQTQTAARKDESHVGSEVAQSAQAARCVRLSGVTATSWCKKFFWRAQRLYNALAAPSQLQGPGGSARHASSVPQGTHRGLAKGWAASKPTAKCAAARGRLQCRGSCCQPCGAGQQGSRTYSVQEAHPESTASKSCLAPWLPKCLHHVWHSHCFDLLVCSLESQSGCNLLTAAPPNAALLDGCPKAGELCRRSTASSDEDSIVTS